MTAYNDEFAWMLDPRLQQRGFISPQTVQMAQMRGMMPPQGKIVGGYSPPPGGLAEYLSGVLAPPTQAAYPTNSPVHELRKSLPPTAAPQSPVQAPPYFPQPEAASAERTVTRQTKGGGIGGELSQMRAGQEQEMAGVQAQGAADQLMAEETGRVYGETFERAKSLQLTRDSMQRRRADAEFDADKKMRTMSAEADLQDRYPGLDIADVQRHQRTVDSPNSTPKQREAAQAALKKAEEIDPEHVYGGSMGRKIAAAIGMALGAYGSALAGTPNYAMQIVQNAIENDIAAQREEFSRRSKSADRKRYEAESQYERVSKYWDTEEQRLDATQLRLWEQAGRLIEQAKVKAASPMAKAQADVMQGQVQARQSALRAGLKLQQANLAIDQMKAEAAGEQIALPNDVVPTGPVDKTVADRIRPVVQAYKQARSALVKMKALRKEWGAEFINRGAVEKGKRLAKTYVEAMKIKAELGGALTPQERELVELLKGDDPLSVGFVMDKLDAALEVLDDDMRAKLEGANLRYIGADSGDYSSAGFKEE